METQLEITASTACDMMARDISRFKAYWDKKRQEDPGNYPATFHSIAEWVEQFMAWSGWTDL